MKNSLLFFTLALSLVYVFLSLTNPISRTSSLALGLTDLQLRLLQLTISVPFIFTWIAGVFGYRELTSYAAHLSDTDQRSAFQRLARAILILVVGSMVPALIGIVRTRLSPTMPEILPIATILTNYIYAFGPLIGMWLILAAIESLSRTAKVTEPPSRAYILGMIFPMALTMLNAALILTNPTRQMASGVNGQASYYLPDMVILITLVLPAAISWIVGTRAVIMIQNYRRQAKGAIYKAALAQFSIGLLLVLFSSIFLQFLLALGSDRLLALGLTGILVVIYLFVIAQAIGYVLVALSGRKFSLVEKILSKYAAESAHESGRTAG